MLRNKNYVGRIGVILLMLVLFIIGFGGIVKSYTSSVPVSLAVPTSSLEISGYATPGALVTIYDGANPTATVTANANGQFVKLISSIASGLHSISVSQQDILGNESSTANRVISIPPQQLTQIEFAVPPTIQISSNNLTEGDVITITGYSEPNQAVDLFLDNQILPYSSTNTSTDGKYTFRMNTTNFFFGSHNLKVKSSSSIGPTEYSKALVFKVSQKQSEEQISSPYNAPGSGVVSSYVPSPVVSAPPNNAEISGDKATISGQSEPNARIIISVNGKEVGSVFADSNGKWIFEFYPTEAKNVVTAVSCQGDICSGPSAPIEFYFGVLGASACKDTIELDAYRLSSTVNKPISLNVLFELNKAQTILIDWGDVSSEKFTVNADAENGVYKHTYIAQGQYNGHVTSAQENNNCIVTKYFTVEVNDKDTGIIPKQFVWIILAGLIFALAFYIRDRYKHETKSKL